MSPEAEVGATPVPEVAELPKTAPVAIRIRLARSAIVERLSTNIVKMAVLVYATFGGAT